MPPAGPRRTREPRTPSRSAHVDSTNTRPALCASSQGRTEKASRCADATGHRPKRDPLRKATRPAGDTVCAETNLFPLLVATDARQFTLPLALRTLRADEQVGVGVLLASALLALLPSVIAFVVMQRQFMRGLTSGAVKG
ncbi:hypothetical protein [Streptomyces sp. AP-93]|uniref:hypothetical protein n=1 Tax=Streptomyces sp. AP-93 TaxID=2929048 RepID=UPI001FAFEDBD|nr:hypothetical protein [Streptomyces sp. AP-93]MCJ0869606.1 hypothetical protein [Streptomyces sp. AP-93]